MEWEERLSDLWASIDDHSEKVFLARMEQLVAELPGQRRRRAVIQIASSLRNIGQASESVALLTAEREVESDDLDDAISATLALALVDTGREREAVSVAVAALSRHMTRYRRSMANYARLLSDHSTG